MMSVNLITGISSRSIQQRGLNLWNQLNPWLLRTEGSIQPNNTNPGFGMIAVRFRSNRSRRGLYDGKDIRTGNNVSFSMKTTKRKFKPNVFVKRLYSEILDEIITFRVTTSALRTMDKFGGLDKYLLQSEHVTEGKGMEVKRRILKRLKYLSANPKDEPNPFLAPSSTAGTAAANETTASEDMEEMSTSNPTDPVSMKE